MAAVPCNCPCSPCYVCNHRVAESAPCPDPGSEDPALGSIIVPCCEECIPCRICYLVTEDTCVEPPSAGGDDVICVPGGTPAYLIFEQCYYDEDEEEDVWQWANEITPAINCTTWTIPTLWLQCRRHRETGDTRWIFQAPTATCAAGGSIPIPPQEFLTYLPGDESCDPFYVEGRFSLLPGITGCPGCFVFVRAELCSRCCLDSGPATLTATVISTATDPQCTCMIGVTALLNRVSTGVYEGTLSFPGCPDARTLTLRLRCCDDIAPGTTGCLRFCPEVIGGCAPTGAASIFYEDTGCFCDPSFVEASYCACPPLMVRYHVGLPACTVGTPYPPVSGCHWCCGAHVGDAASFTVLITF